MGAPPGCPAAVLAPARVIGRLLLAAGFLFLATTATPLAQDRPEAGDLGSLLGYTILCDCVPGDPDWLMSVYFAIIENAYDRDLAEAMSGHMRVALNSGWDNEMSICARVCGMEITQDLRELVAGIDGVVGSPEFQPYIATVTDDGGGESAQSAPSEPVPSWCAFKPFNPQCTQEP